MRRLHWMSSVVFGLLISVLAEGALSSSPTPTPPSIESVLKPKIFQKVVKDRTIEAYASLDDVEGVKTEPPLKNYSFYAAMLARATLSKTRQVLTDYQLYSKLIPYVDEANYQPSTRTLELKGGIWKWKLSSVLSFEELSDRWIRFRVIGGHFTGMTGEFFFEPRGARGDEGTLVYMRGTQQGSHWPPAFILVHGAQIVFEFTAKRMRSYLEENTQKERSGRSYDPSDPQIPQPRSHL